MPGVLRVCPTCHALLVFILYPRQIQIQLHLVYMTGRCFTAPTTKPFPLLHAT